MRPVRLPLLVLGVLALAACTQPPQQAPSPSSAAAPTSTTSGPAAPPPGPGPVRTADCPYLSTEVVEQRNGQGVGEVRVSAGKRPSCFFYRPDGERQLRTRIFRGRLDIVRALVDQAAPVRTSARASLPGGWEGGAQPTGSGSVYAVARPDGKDPDAAKGTAVIVHSNQAQSVKARELARFVIRELRL